jgi:prophage tail gpP-like protein
MVGYPGADLVTAAGGVLVHVARRPANAAPRLELQPGEVATADVAASAVDSATDTACARTGTLVVTAPDTVRPHTLEVNLPICEATISAVG